MNPDGRWTSGDLLETNNCAKITGSSNHFSIASQSGNYANGYKKSPFVVWDWEGWRQKCVWRILHAPSWRGWEPRLVPKLVLSGELIWSLVDWKGKPLHSQDGSGFIVRLFSGHLHMRNWICLSSTGGHDNSKKQFKWWKLGTLLILFTHVHLCPGTDLGTAWGMPTFWYLVFSEHNLLSH